MYFKQAVEHVLTLEGGESDHAADRGGHTKYGISKRSYPNLDIESLAKKDAIAIYKADFWTPNSYDHIREERLAKTMLSFAVVAGSKRANSCLQAGISCFSEMISVDGIVGPETRGAMFELSENQYAAINHHVQDLFLMHAFSIVKNDPTQEVFLKGWINRAIGQHKERYP